MRFLQLKQPRRDLVWPLRGMGRRRAVLLVASAALLLLLLTLGSVGPGLPSPELLPEPYESRVMVVLAVGGSVVVVLGVVWEVSRCLPGCACHLHLRLSLASCNRSPDCGLGLGLATRRRQGLPFAYCVSRSPVGASCRVARDGRPLHRRRFDCSVSGSLRDSRWALVSIQRSIALGVLGATAREINT